MDRLKGKVCIVTGGARGLGLAYCKAMAEQGAKVVIADIADGHELAGDIGATFIHTDVSQPDSAKRCVEETLQKHGSIDVLVNNAALYSTLPMVRYSDIELELWDQVMAVNIRGAFTMIKFVGPVMEAQESGKIINITSGTTYKGMPGMLHYISSKGALVAMTRALSRELGPKNICVNNLSPGLILSESILENQDHVNSASDPVLASRAFKRHGYPEDLLGALLFLASGDSDFVTGQTIAVDGGSINT